MFDVNERRQVCFVAVCHLWTRYSPAVSRWLWQWYACFDFPSSPQGGWPVSVVTIHPLRTTDGRPRTRRYHLFLSFRHTDPGPLRPRTGPTRRSARVKVGSIRVPTPIRPPGTANCKSLASAYREEMRELIGEGEKAGGEALERPKTLTLTFFLSKIIARAVACKSSSQPRVRFGYHWYRHLWSPSVTIPNATIEK